MAARSRTATVRRVRAGGVGLALAFAAYTGCDVPRANEGDQGDAAGFGIDAAAPRDADVDVAFDSESSPNASELDAHDELSIADANDEPPIGDAPIDVSDDALQDAANDWGTPTETCEFALAAPGSQMVDAVAVAPDGTIGVAGEFYDPFDMGDGVLDAGAGRGGGYVATLDRSCKLKWSRQYGAAVTGIAFDSTGALWAAATLSPSSSSPIFGGLRKYTDSGAVLVDKTFGAPGVEYASAQDVTVAADDAVFVVGHYDATAGLFDLGGGPLPASDTENLFVAKFTDAGHHVWSEGLGSANPVDGGTSCAQRLANDVTLDPQGNVVIAGSIGGRPGCRLSLGGADLPSAESNPSAYVGSLSAADGAHIWSHGLANGAYMTHAASSPTSVYVANAENALLADGGPARGWVSRIVDGGIAWRTALSDDAGTRVLNWGIASASIGERALVATMVVSNVPNGPFKLQIVEADGGLGWSRVVQASADVVPVVATGLNRDFVYGGTSGSGNGPFDIFVVRFIR
jgi:hypothetical protein